MLTALNEAHSHNTLLTLTFYLSLTLSHSLSHSLTHTHTLSLSNLYITPKHNNSGEVNFSMLGTVSGVLASGFVSLNGIFTTKVSLLIERVKRV